jgi:hypothetical protein
VIPASASIGAPVTGPTAFNLAKDILVTHLFASCRNPALQKCDGLFWIVATGRKVAWVLGKIECLGLVGFSSPDICEMIGA